MKTNQVMLRPMGCFSVEQRTKDGVFNASALLKQWNESAGDKKEIKKFFENQNTKEFISALIEEENLNGEKSAYLTSRGKYNGGTWMHPILFVKFAMWLNPRFEVKVIKFIYDQMIAYRNEAGDAYRELSMAVAKIVAPNFMQSAMKQLAQAINYCVFNEHETAIRNKHGEESKMRQLFELERKVASLIDDGFITKFDDMMEYLRNQWRKVNVPRAFQIPIQK
nr:KilA-N domain-containing protein [Bacteroides acidifaciens]